jgi:GT2 family glycosyltransferase
MLSIIIVNYNVRYFIEACLHSVEKACKTINAEIFVVDNASTDDSKWALPSLFPNVHFIWNEDNLGFSKANNLAIKKATGQYILFLNPDTIVPEDCFEKCLTFFSTHHDAGALGVHMIDGNGNFHKESKRSFPAPAVSFYKMIGLSNLFPNSTLFAAYYAGHLPENKTASVEVLSGAFMMISKKIMDRVKGFDEDYFMYAEDIDMSYRVKKTGFKNYYFADTSIIHFKGESTKKTDAEYVRNFYGAMKLFVNKHYRQQNFIKNAMMISIATAQFLANSKRKINNIRKSKSFEFNDYKHTQSIVITANNETFNQMLHVIKQAKNKFLISGRIKINAQDIEPASTTLPELNNYLSNNHTDFILFCEGKNNLSFIEIIETLKSNPIKSICLFNINNQPFICGNNYIIAESIEEEPTIDSANLQ